MFLQSGREATHLQISRFRQKIINIASGVYMNQSEEYRLFVTYLNYNVAIFASIDCLLPTVWSIFSTVWPALSRPHISDRFYTYMQIGAVQNESPKRYFSCSRCDDAASSLVESQLRHAAHVDDVHNLSSD